MKTSTLIHDLVNTSITVDADTMDITTAEQSLNRATSIEIADAIFEILEDRIEEDDDIYYDSIMLLKDMPQIVLDNVLRYVVINLDVIPNWHDLDRDELAEYITNNR
jgi:hypothetical protein